MFFTEKSSEILSNSRRLFNLKNIIFCPFCWNSNSLEMLTKNQFGLTSIFKFVFHHTYRFHFFFRGLIHEPHLSRRRVDWKKIQVLASNLWWSKACEKNSNQSSQGSNSFFSETTCLISSINVSIGNFKVVEKDWIDSSFAAIFA